MEELIFNDPAPDLDILTANGEKIRLSSLWAKQPLILSFIRHFGCPQCKETLDYLVDLQAEIAAHGLTIAVVTQAEPAEAKAFGQERAPGLLFLADPRREAYAAYGLGQGTLAQTILSPRVWMSNARLARQKGYKTELPPAGQDAMQMGGTFIIGVDGRIRLPYYFDDIADHPEASLLLGGVMGTDWSRPLDGPLGPESAK